MEIATAIAKELFDGHVTMMRFTSNWRVSFGYQPQSREDIDAMPSGPTLLSAVNAAIRQQLPKGGKF